MLAIARAFTVHRPLLYEKGAIKTETTFYHPKARFEELGNPCKLSLNFKIKEGKYVSVDYDV